MSVAIIPAYGHEQEIKMLFTEYTQMLMDNDKFMRQYLAVQHYDDEVKNLRGKYGEPEGRLYLAYVEDKAAGCIALRKLDERRCEMKRLYVRPQFRNHKLGEQLVDKVIGEAKKIGYRHMLLDTIPFLHSAIHLYRKHGFYEIDKYNDNPDGNAIYMQLDL